MEGSPSVTILGNLRGVCTALHRLDVHRVTMKTVEV